MDDVIMLNGCHDVMVDAMTSTVRHDVIDDIITSKVHDDIKVMINIMLVNIS